MNRRAGSAVVANPILVGAVTVLVVVIAVFLGYNANNGLPFVPTRLLKVEIANGANLVPGNEVRSGGFRIGVVDDMQAVRLPGGKVGARLELKLDDAFGRVPVDSTVVVRSRSALGLKYVELTRGSAARTYESGDTLPAAQAKVPVDIDDVYDIFDARTRKAGQEALGGYGTALAGRGVDLNSTIVAAPSLFAHLAHVTRNLADPQTALPTFLAELDDAARVLAPVSRLQAGLFGDMATTFDAISRDPRKLQSTIAKGPDTLSVGTRSLQVNRPFLQDTALFARDLQGAARSLRSALPTVNRALAVGIPVTRRSTGLYEDLKPPLRALTRLAQAPTTTGALRGVEATVTTLQPQLRFVGPYVTVCNHFNSFWTFAAEHLSAPDLAGSGQRALLNMGPSALPGVGSNDGIDGDAANEFAHGKVSDAPGAVEEQLHAGFYGSAIKDDGTAECEAGQQGYLGSANPFRDRSNGDPYQRVVVDHPADYGVRVGRNYAHFDRAGRGTGLGPARGPAGETYTARPGGTGVDTPPLTSYPAEAAR